MINADVLEKVRNGVCAVGYLSVPLVEYQNSIQSPFFKVVGTGFLVRDTTVITNRHVIKGLADQQADLGVPTSQLFLSFVVPGPNDHFRVTLRMIRHRGVLSNEQLDVGFVEFAIVNQLHFEGISPLQITSSQDLHVSEELFGEIQSLRGPRVF